MVNRFKRYPVGRIVWVKVLGQWARGAVAEIHAGTVIVPTDAGLKIYVHHSALTTAVRVTEPYTWS